MIDLPAPRLTTEQVPLEARPWVEKSLMAPLNRFLVPVAAILKRVMLSQLNVQILEYRGYPPTVSLPADFPSTLTGGCIGVLPLLARTLEANGQLGVSVGELTSPHWVEVVKPGQSGATLRVTSQQTDADAATTLSGTTRYLLRWIAVGG